MQLSEQQKNKGSNFYSVTLLYS